MLYQVFCVFKSWPSRTLILAVKEIKTQIIFYAVQRSYRSSYTNNCCCSLYSDVATLDCCCQPAKQWEIKFTLEFFQTHTHTQNKKNSQQKIMCYVCINIYGGWEEGQKTTSALHDISWQANKSWIPKLWPSLFHIHLKARVAVCAPLSTSPPPLRPTLERGESIVSVEATPVCARWHFLWVNLQKILAAVQNMQSGWNAEKAPSFFFPARPR